MSEFLITRSPRDGEYYTLLRTPSNTIWVLPQGSETEEEARRLVMEMKLAAVEASVRVDKPDPDAPVDGRPVESRDEESGEVARPEDDIEVLHAISDIIDQGELPADALTQAGSIKVDWVNDKLGYVVTRAEIDKVLAG